MRTIGKLWILALALGLASSAVAQPAADQSPAGGQVEWIGAAPPGTGGIVMAMKQIAPGVGWAERAQRFYWTTDNGASWRDITPPQPEGDSLGEHVSGLFFLDQNRGWAVISRFEEHPTEAYEVPKFDLASTTDAGATWNRIPLLLPPPADYGNSDRMPLRGWGGEMAFLDPLHGWMNITLAQDTPTSFFAFLLMTSDGGRTWNRVANAPVLEDASLLLVSADDGWMLGSSRETGEQLFVTHDGTKSWQQVSMNAPKEVPSATLPHYDEMVTFTDSKHGYFPVRYTGGVNVRSASVLFETANGGRTWRPGRMVLNHADSSKYSRNTVTDASWIFVALSDDHPVLTRVGAEQKVDASADVDAAAEVDYKAVLQISFGSASDGWVVSARDGALLATEDGGAAWTVVTPGPRPHITSPDGSTSTEQRGPVIATSNDNSRATNVQALCTTCNITSTLDLMRRKPPVCRQ